jgi:mRNA-degrading endonuclease HigB of HigAB toxin-antitoxin module
MGAPYAGMVRVIVRRMLREFCQKHADAEPPLCTWFDVRATGRQGRADVVRVYATIVVDDRIVFNIARNNTRSSSRLTIDYVQFGARKRDATESKSP